MKYRKKPIVIEAYQWFTNGDHPEDGSRNNEGQVVKRYTSADNDSLCDQCGYMMYHHGWVETLEGGHCVCPGDYIITGVKGERYPCKPDIFKDTYEPV